MPAPTRPERIRDYISKTLEHLGARPQTTTRDTLLIRAGNYCGHRIQRDGYQAVWFVEEDEVKFYGPDGRLLDASRPSQAVDASTRKAA